MEGSSWMRLAIRCVANCMRAEYGWSVLSYGGIVAPCTCERDGQTPFNFKRASTACGTTDPQICAKP
jgi:hypothetical protein